MGAIFILAYQKYQQWLASLGYDKSFAAFGSTVGLAAMNTPHKEHKKESALILLIKEKKSKQQQLRKSTESLKTTERRRFGVRSNLYQPHSHWCCVQE